MSDESSNEAPRTVRLDRELVRALAHPMRNRILGLLRVYGPQTATTLAGRLGVNTGATSYHLRQLAEAGLVIEDDSRGNARDRWWKAAHQGTEFDKAELLDQEPELALGFLHGVGQSYAENIFSFIDAVQTMPADWRDASVLSDYFFHLRADQLDAMMQEVLAVLEKYKTADLTAPLPEGAEQVTVQLQAFPRETR
ncbi:DNA-binding transcriptional ArsR family regulator [Kribbella aluminosa]|uniref:DNA-binding transcriptional ArsR family regulator n=1 Tax=Kribbella aluminosa TaxID=416017 RepID=A0ABS4UE89_9ACTN|nr:helix-turn-helix domain-containing protein [Kribbella aluminosa]MBP2349938.1 DNA-binding transcriptional ArsR family regulator [Kribbella aluminosa]